MRIDIDEQHLEAWAERPPQKRKVVSDLSMTGFQVWREPSGQISFRHRYVSPVTRKRQTITIGKWPFTSYTDAKIKSLKLSEAVQKGRDPKLEGEGVTTELTLSQLLIQMTESEGALFRRTKGKEGLAPRTAADYQRYLFDHYGAMADLPVIYLQRNPHIILSHIAAIRSKGSESIARLVKASMSSAFSWGIQTGLIPMQINPCLAQYRTRRKKAAARTIQRFLTIDELKYLLKSLDHEIAGKTVNVKRRQAAVVAMIKLMLYTGCRPNEAAGAFRDEFDLTEGLWTIPGHRPYQWNDTERIRRTKNGKKHIIPLPHQAVELVAGIIDTSTYSPWLFPVRRFVGTPKNPYMQTPKNMLERIFKESPGENVTPHSLRRTVATQLEELGFSDKPLVSRILNHTPQDVTSKHYLGGTGLDQMRKALQKLADYMDRLKTELDNKVVKISTYQKAI